jgi:hypothetical protein
MRWAVQWNEARLKSPFMAQRPGIGAGITLAPLNVL